MVALDSDKVDKALRKKMKAECKDGIDCRYIIRNDQGIQIAVTRISKGAKHVLRSNRVNEMAKQLGLDKQQFVDLVSCTLSREMAIEIIER